MTAQTTKLHLIFTRYDTIKGQPTAHPTQTTKLHHILEHWDEMGGQPKQLKLRNYTWFSHAMIQLKDSRQLIQLKLPNYTLF